MLFRDTYVIPKSWYFKSDSKIRQPLFRQKWQAVVLSSKHCEPLLWCTCPLRPGRPDWAIVFYFGQFFDNYPFGSDFWATFLHGKSYDAFTLTKNGLGHILGEFVTSTSGHPVSDFWVRWLEFYLHLGDTDLAKFCHSVISPNEGSMLWFQFSAILNNFRQKIGVFLKDQCYDTLFA
jgi:hypothetical protein